MGGDCSAEQKIGQQDRMVAAEGSDRYKVGYETERHGFLGLKCRVKGDVTESAKLNSGTVKLYKPKPDFTHDYDGKGYCGQDSDGKPIQCGEYTNLNKYHYYDVTDLDSDRRGRSDSVSPKDVNKFDDKVQFIEKVYNIKGKPANCSDNGCYTVTDVKSDDPRYITRGGHSGVQSAGDLFRYIPLSGHSESLFNGDTNDTTKDVNVYVQQVGHNFTGGLFNASLVSGPYKNEMHESQQTEYANKKRNPEAIQKENALLTMFTTEDDMLYFNDNVFKFWVHEILRQEYLDLIVSDIYNMVKDNIELICINKINNYCRQYPDVREKTDSNGNHLSRYFVNIPIGAPLVSIETPLLFDYKFYYSAYNVNALDIANNKYNPQIGATNNIINIMDMNEKTLDRYNYLDQFFDENIMNCIIEGIRTVDTAGVYDDDICFCLTIPRKGCQIIETIAKDSTNQDPDYKIAQSNNLVYQTTITNIESQGQTILPQILVTLKPLTDKLNSAYDNVFPEGINISIVEFNNNITDEMHKDNLKVTINTRTDGQSKNNKCYIYVSKSDKCFGAYTLLTSFSDSKTLGGFETKCFAIQYDGSETKKTPTFLQPNLTLGIPDDEDF